jgi:hypothetical protein
MSTCAGKKIMTSNSEMVLVAHNNGHGKEICLSSSTADLVQPGFSVILMRLG